MPSGAGQYAPMPPVFGPRSPSKTALWSWHAGRGMMVRPLTSASTESSSPSSFFSTTISPAGLLAELRVGHDPLDRLRCPPAAFLQTTTPLPAASPSAFTTTG